MTPRRQQDRLIHRGCHLLLVRFSYHSMFSDQFLTKEFLTQDRLNGRGVLSKCYCILNGNADAPASAAPGRPRTATKELGGVLVPALVERHPLFVAGPLS